MSGRSHRILVFSGAGIFLLILTMAALVRYGLVRVEHQLRYPLILVHGMGGSPEDWLAPGGLVEHLHLEHGLQSGGVIHVDSASRQVVQTGGTGKDVFSVAFSDPYAGLEQQARELGAMVAWVRRETGKDRVVLVGFSMGGVTGREYLVEQLSDHGVRKLVTVGSPNLGSPLAKFYNTPADLQRQKQRFHCSSASRNLRCGSLAMAGRGLARLEEEARRRLGPGFSFAAPALRDLRPLSAYPQLSPSPPSRLEFLDTAAHPLDVEYACVTGRMGIDAFFDSVFDGTSRSWNDLMLLVAVNAFSGGGSSDGVVSEESQNLNYVTWFRGQKKVPTILVDGVMHGGEFRAHRAVAEAVGENLLRRDWSFAISSGREKPTGPPGAPQR